MRRMHCHGVSIIRATPTRMQGGRFARASQATLGERAKSWGPSCRRLRALIVFVCLHAGATRTELAPALAYGDGLSPSKRQIAVSTSGVFPRMERIACECGAIPASSRRSTRNILCDVPILRTITTTVAFFVAIATAGTRASVERVVVALGLFE